MKVLVLGWGISGRVAARHFEGDSVWAVDERYPCLSALPEEGPDLVVKSPGIPSDHPWLQELSAPVTSEMELGLEALAAKGKTVLGITGSNGKTTTTVLTTHILQTAGLKACAVGNIGTPVLDVVGSDADIFVVEVSSFQLEMLSKQVFDAGVLLNITPNHLDRYPTFEAYAAVKRRLRDLVKGEGGFCDDFGERVERIGKVVYRDGVAAHDLENAAAAQFLCERVGVSEGAFVRGVQTFEKPPHRLEWVGRKRGVDFVNDSKATSVDAVLKGVASIEGPVVLLAGGVDKGGEFRQWISPFREKVRRVFVFGEAAERIESELSPHIAVERVATLEEGVERATACAQEGETILLSPGCSSFDQFRGYAHRGEVFKQIVGG